MRDPFPVSLYPKALRRRAAIEQSAKLFAAYTRLRAAIPDPAQPGDDFPEKVIAALRGIGAAAWIELDERSGYRDLGPWFSLVRQTRNSARFGPALICAVNNEEAWP